MSPRTSLAIAALAVLGQGLFLAAGLALFEGRAEFLIEAHDAKFYLDQIGDPFLLNPATTAGWGDISYWGLRIGYPLLGWPLHFILGRFGALVAVNAIAAAIGSIWAARLALGVGKSPWWGLVLAVNPATLFAAGLLLPDTVAYAAVIGVLVAASGRRWVLATVLAVLAVATKEASLAPLALAALYYWQGGEKQAALTVVVPLAWHVGWAINLTSRFDDLQSAGFVTWPFVGFVEAARRVWLAGDPIHPAFFVAIAMLILAVIAVVGYLRRPTPALAAAVGAGLIYPFMDWEVLYPLSNVPRIGGWLFPLLAIGWVSSQPAKTQLSEPL